MERSWRDRITVSTVLIAGHAGPDTMIWIADQGKGRFYNVDVAGRFAADFHQGSGGDFEIGDLRGPVQAAVAVVQRSGARHRRGRISDAARLRGDDAEAARGNAAGDGQGRSAAGALAVRAGPGGGVHVRREGEVGARTGWAGASTSSSGRRSRNGACGGWRTRISRRTFRVDKGEGQISVEALDEQGNYRNFLDLEAIVVDAQGRAHQRAGEADRAGALRGAVSRRRKWAPTC